jgi:hypothetical protein
MSCELHYKEIAERNKKEMSHKEYITEVLYKYGPLVSEKYKDQIKTDFDKAFQILEKRVYEAKLHGARCYDFIHTVALPFGSVSPDASVIITDIDKDDLFVVNYFLDCNTPYGNAFGQYLTQRGYEFNYYVSLKVWYKS